MSPHYSACKNTHGAKKLEKNFFLVVFGLFSGTEFWNGPCDKVFKKYKITLYALRDPNKAALAEFGIRWLKRKIYQHITYQRDRDKRPAVRYVDDLDSMVAGINATVNRRTRFAPKDASFKINT